MSVTIAPVSFAVFNPPRVESPSLLNLSSSIVTGSSAKRAGKPPRLLDITPAPQNPSSKRFGSSIRKAAMLFFLT